MFYVDINDKYYVLDEDLKVLNVLDKTSEEPSGLIKIETDNINISSTTMKCDFVGTKAQQKAIYNLFVAMTTVVTEGNGIDEAYLSREDMKNRLKSIKFEKIGAINKLAISTSYGVELDIENPQSEMQKKINICFSAIKQFVEDANDKEKSGTIKIYYNENNELTSVYIPQT